MSCIEASGLSKSYGPVKAVDSIELSVEPGQVFGFLGPNGAGKSTCIKLLTTLIAPSSGSISVLGIDARADPLAVRRRIGVVLQQPSYEPTLSVEKSLDKYGMMWNVPGDERARRAERLLEEFDLAGIRKTRNVDLSIGQRRRVQVAREFMHDMDLLFLDEPTVGLDPGARRRLLDYLKARAGEGLTIFYTTHILTEVEYFCDKIAIINGGRIVTVDTPDALKERLGSGKTIRISLQENAAGVSALLSDVAGCRVEPGRAGGEGGGGGGTSCTITIHSDGPEQVLQEVLAILNSNDMAISDLSAVPTSLEDIFLRMVRDGGGGGDGRQAVAGTTGGGGRVQDGEGGGNASGDQAR